jgi:small conductance mechanosensitive channel
VLADPAPFARAGELADSSVNFSLRVWVNTADYWDVFFDLTEQVKEELDRRGISIPYPQIDVHMVGNA